MERYEFLLGMMGMVMSGVVVMTVVTTIGRVVMRRREGSALGEGAAARIDERLSRMEQAIDAMAVEVERVAEGQRFATRLLSERAGERQPH